jgi:hypothetical protein
MAARSGTGAPLTAVWSRHRPHFRHSRRRRQIGPVVEALEDRLTLTAASPTNPVPIGPKPTGNPTPQQLGSAYRQVVTSQTTTLLSLGNSYREVQAAGAQLANRTAGAIDELKAERSQVKTRHQTRAIARAICRDLHLLNLGGAQAARVENGLDVARGVADALANTDKIYIPNHLFTNLTEFVREDQSTGAAIAKSGQRSANALVRNLDGLGDQLTTTITVLSARDW